MIDIFVLIWIFLGIWGCHLMSSLSAKHSDMEQYTPASVWFVISGPIILCVASFIGLGYALRWNEEFESEPLPAAPESTKEKP